MNPFLLGLVSGAALVVVLLCITLGAKSVLGDTWSWPPDVAVWGTVGQWASSVFAGLSILVALNIVRRDRDKESWTEARRITSSCDMYSIAADNFGNGPNLRVWTITMKVHNNSDAAIHGLIFSLDTKNDPRFVESGVLREEMIAEVEPHALGRAQFTLHMRDRRDNGDIDIRRALVDTARFRTQDGVLWDLRCNSGVLNKAGKSRRLNYARQ